MKSRPLTKPQPTVVGELVGVPRPADAGSAWLVLLVAGVLAATCLGIVESTGTRVALLALVDIVSISAVLVGLRRHRPEHPGMWLVLAVGMFILGLGSMLSNLGPTTSRTTASAS